MANEKLIDTSTLTYFESKLQNKYATKTELASYLPLSGGTMSGDIDFSTSTSWIKPYLLAFKNADTSSSPTYPYTGFYQWGNEWQVNARDSNNSWAHNLLTINLNTKVATFAGSLISGGNLYFGSSTSSSNYISTEDGGSRLGLHGISGIKSFNHIVPSTTESYDLGDYATTGGQVISNKRWRNLYLSGNLSDGTNSISIANIANKSSLSNYVALTGNQTISGLKYFSGNGLKVTGRVAGGGDDEGIVVEQASNSYAGVCCGSPSGRRAVFYLRPNDSCWRYSNGSTSYDIVHPAKSGTIALTSDISGKQDTLVSGTNIKTINNSSILGSGNLTVTATETVGKVTICATETAVAVTGGSAYLFLPYGQTGTFANSASGQSYTFYGPALYVGGYVYYSNSTTRNFASTQYIASLTPLYRFKGIIIKIV